MTAPAVPHSRRGRIGAQGRAYTVTSPVPAGVWEEVLASAPQVLASQTPEWLRCVCAVGGFEDASRLYETADGRRLVLPLARRTVLGRMILSEASMPFGWGPAGLLGESGVVLPDDVRMVFGDLAAHRALRVWLRPEPAAAATWEEGRPPWTVRRPAMAQSLSLAGGFDEVWRTRFRRDTRNRINRAERAEVVVERDDTGRLVPVFQRLYAMSVERWARHEGQPVALAQWRAALREPAGKLRTVAERLGARCRVYAGFVDGRPAAAIVVLFTATTATYWRGAMNEELAGRTYANYLLHRAAIRDAAEAGCAAYHMGDSRPGSPLALFKSRFGAVEQHYASYWLERLPVASLTERARRRAGAALQQLRGRR